MGGDNWVNWKNTVATAGQLGETRYKWASVGGDISISASKL